MSALGRSLPTALAAAALLALPCLAHAGPSPAAASPVGAPAGTAAAGGADLAGSFWSWLGRLWPAGGCLIDPSGQCVAPPRPATPPAAPHAAGRRARLRPNAGCGIDPSGGNCS